MLNLHTTYSVFSLNDCVSVVCAYRLSNYKKIPITLKTPFPVFQNKTDFNGLQFPKQTRAKLTLLACTILLIEAKDLMFNTYKL